MVHVRLHCNVGNISMDFSVFRFSTQALKKPRRIR